MGSNSTSHDKPCKIYFKNQKSKESLVRNQKKLPTPKKQLDVSKLQGKSTLHILEKYQKCSGDLQKAKNQNDILEAFHSSFEDLKQGDNDLSNISGVKPKNHISIESPHISSNSPKMVWTSKNKHKVNFIDKSKFSTLSDNADRSMVSKKRFKASNSEHKTPMSLVKKEQTLRRK